MVKKSNRHVTKNPDGTWNNLLEGNQRATSVHNTQAEAETAAIAQAKREKTEVIVHGKDGKIKRRNSYGNDPYPPKG